MQLPIQETITALAFSSKLGMLVSGTNIGTVMVSSTDDLGNPIVVQGLINGKVIEIAILGDCIVVVSRCDASETVTMSVLQRQEDVY
jgi:hypothetical protein